VEVRINPPKVQLADKKFPRLLNRPPLQLKLHPLKQRRQKQPPHPKQLHQQKPHQLRTKPRHLQQRPHLPLHPHPHPHPQPRRSTLEPKLAAALARVVD
jgi:hypothetical protein